MSHSITCSGCSSSTTSSNMRATLIVRRFDAIFNAAAPTPTASSRSIASSAADSGAGVAAVKADWVVVFLDLIVVLVLVVNSCARPRTTELYGIVATIPPAAAAAATAAAAAAAAAAAVQRKTLPR